MTHDVIVVGSGCTGGWAAKQLGERGLRVLVLEAGPLLDPEVVRDARVWAPEARYAGGLLALRQRQPIQVQHPAFHRYNSALFVDDLDHPYTAPADAPFLWIRGRQVGGRSLLWMGATQRMSDHELHDWPLSHADLDRHYATVERFLGVMGARDGLDALPDGELVAPAPLTEAEQRFRTIVERDWPERRVIHARGVPVRTAAPPPPGQWPRFSSPGSTLAAALATGHVTLQPDAIVARILVDTDARRASGVRFIDRVRGDPHERFARAIVLCGSTIETIRLLAGSQLGTSSGLLGCGLMDHPSVGLSGAVPAFRGSTGGDELNGPNGFYIPRFHHSYGIWGRIGRGAARSDGAAPFRMHATCEMRPRPDNRVTIDPDTRDAWGLPGVRIECRLSDHERAMIDDATGVMREMIERLGGQVEQVATFVPGQTIHEVGGARMGTDPATSVTDPFGRLWDVENVFVADGACWPSSGYQNPTLTMMALAVRTCEVVEA